MATKKRPSKVKFNALLDADQCTEAMEYAQTQHDLLQQEANEWLELANNAQFMLSLQEKIRFKGQKKRVAIQKCQRQARADR